MIKCPVEEIAKNSVSPSTMPRTSAIPQPFIMVALIVSAQFGRSYRFAAARADYMQGFFSTSRLSHQYIFVDSSQRSRLLADIFRQARQILFLHDNQERLFHGLPLFTKLFVIENRITPRSDQMFACSDRVIIS